jgi:hypothetical protein
VAVARRRPVVPVGAALGVLLVWNVGLLVSFRDDRYAAAAPLDRVFADQGANLRALLLGVSGKAAGTRGRALAYKVLDGEYLYESYGDGGLIGLAGATERDLGRAGWSEPRRKDGEPAFRWAMTPESCLRLPLSAPAALPATILARAPAATQPQTMTVLWNGRPAGTFPLGTEWQETRVRLRAEDAVPGENFLCLRFARALPATRPEEAVPAAQVVSVELP